MDWAPNRAKPVLMHAAQCKHGPSAFTLSKEDPDNRIKWLTLGADHGHTKSIYKLGKAYLHGKDVTEDKTKAFELFNKCGDYAKALRRRGQKCEKENRYDEAYHLYRQAGEQGDVKSFYLLAVFLQYEYEF
jgi:TPR repeat protein